MIVSFTEQLACVEREIAMRKRVYPRWIEAGKMTKAKADAEIRTMEAVAETLRGLTGIERLL
jgi:vacuolar-type H+-ATPase subunit C/Vma6